MEEKSLPWASFNAFLTAVNTIMNDDSFPTTFDPNKLPFKATYVEQLLYALQFLGFLDQTGKVTTVFRDFREHPGERPNILQSQLRSKYPAMFTAGGSLTEQKVVDEISKTNLSPVIQRKVFLFLINAAEFAGINVTLKRALRKRGKPVIPTSTPKASSNVQSESAAALQIYQTAKGVIHTGNQDLDHLPEALVALLKDLPPVNTEWTHGKNEWLQVFKTVFYYCYGKPAKFDLTLFSWDR